MFSKSADDLEALKAKAAGADHVAGQDVEESIKMLDEKVTALKAQHEKEYNAIQELRTTRDGQMSGVKKFIDEKKTVRDAVSELIAERDSIYDEKREMQKVFNQWEKEQRQEKQKKWAEQEALINAQWEAEQAQREMDKPNPYLDEMTLLEQTIDYCKLMLPKEDKAEDKEEQKWGEAPVAGAKMLLKKNDREAEMYMSYISNTIYTSWSVKNHD